MKQKSYPVDKNKYKQVYLIKPIIHICEYSKEENLWKYFLRHNFNYAIQQVKNREFYLTNNSLNMIMKIIKYIDVDASVGNNIFYRYEWTNDSEDGPVIEKIKYLAQIELLVTTTNFNDQYNVSSVSIEEARELCFDNYDIKKLPRYKIYQNKKYKRGKKYNDKYDRHYKQHYRTHESIKYSYEEAERIYCPVIRTKRSHTKIKSPDRWMDFITSSSNGWKDNTKSKHQWSRHMK